MLLLLLLLWLFATGFGTSGKEVFAGAVFVKVEGPAEEEDS